MKAKLRGNGGNTNPMTRGQFMDAYWHTTKRPHFYGHDACTERYMRELKLRTAMALALDYWHKYLKATDKEQRAEYARLYVFWKDAYDVISQA